MLSKARSAWPIFKSVIGKPISEASHDEQAAFVLWEMEHPEQAGMTVEQRDQILNAKTPARAAMLIDKFYERSSGKHSKQRIAAANRYGRGGGQKPNPALIPQDGAGCNRQRSRRKRSARTSGKHGSNAIMPALDNPFQDLIPGTGAGPLPPRQRCKPGGFRLKPKDEPAAQTPAQARGDELSNQLKQQELGRKEAQSRFT
jgi:hypothetical protein